MKPVLFRGERTSDLLEALKKEVMWELPTMFGTPITRYSATQAEIVNGLIPAYRYSVDTLLKVTIFSPTVLRIRDRLHAVFGEELGLNHVLIQLYADGRAYITPHSDKTLDIARDSNVVNFSLGESRTMKFTRKVRQEGDEGEQLHLTDDSALIMGPQTNRDHLHGIPRDHRSRGERISLTFRRIATFIDVAGGKVVGQGAGPTGEIPMDDSYEARMALIYKFGNDNKFDSSQFDWDATYGAGSGFTFRVMPES